MNRPIGPQSLVREVRERFHAELLQTVLTVNDRGVYSNADGGSQPSTAIAARMAQLLRAETVAERLAGQTSGNRFEVLVANFVRDTFCRLQHLRPGHWRVEQTRGARTTALARYVQYAHLTALSDAAAESVDLAAALGNDYSIKPDVVVYRLPALDDEINAPQLLIDDGVAEHAVLRQKVNPCPILHASISCKWTMRSDRAQNTRTEALNLIRNRKGRLPHIVAVMGEPLPSRISSVALGTGDIDCTYHMALPELQEAVDDVGGPEDRRLMRVMVQGGRLKDISDLPFDLAV